MYREVSWSSLLKMNLNLQARCQTRSSAIRNERKVLIRFDTLYLRSAGYLIGIGRL